MTSNAAERPGTALPPRKSSRITGSGQISGRTRTADDGQSYNPVGQNNVVRGIVSPFGYAPYHPAGDAQTYRDLLIFEERLKQNAARLLKRRTKYQTFLVLLCGAIGLSAYYVFVRPAQWQPLHYLNVTVLLITATMLLLFFASGMYAERITAANKFVPQANRSLRSYNIYLNTKTVPRRPLLWFLKSPELPMKSGRQATALVTDSDAGSGNVRTLAPSSLEKGTGSRSAVVGGASAGRRLHIASIPPSTNSRGELIFGSKVSPTFREGYERYRAAFERRRREKMDERQRRGWRRWWIAFTSSSDGAAAGAPSADGRITQVRKADGSMAAKSTGNDSNGVGRGTTSPSLRANASLRSSPRSSRTRPRVNVEGGVLASGSENSSPSSSRAPSPSTSPKVAGVAVMPSAPGGREERRGRLSSSRTVSSGKFSHTDVLMELSNGQADILEDGDLLPPKEQARRGRDRTPSITAVSDERLLRRRSTSSGVNSETGGSETLKPALDPATTMEGTIVEESPHEEAASTSLEMPDPQKVLKKSDSRSDVEATLREPTSTE